MKPVIDQVINERPDIEYVSVDIDKDTPTALQYSVMGVPTFVIEENGEIVKRITGAMTKNQFIDALDI
jgi:thioredoxin 1